MTAAIVALGLVVALLAVLVVGLLRSHAEILRALHGLGVGERELTGAGGSVTRRQSRAGAAAASPNEEGDAGDPGIRTVPGVAAPDAASALGRLSDISGVDPHGGAVRIGLRGAKGTTLLAFLSTGCSTCHDFWQAFATDAVDDVPGEGTRIVVVTQGPEEESPATVAEMASNRVITVMSSAAWDDYDVPVSPYFLLVDGAHGVVGEGASATWAQVVDLLRKAAADAGMAVDGRARLSRRDLLTGRDRELRADRELAAAGIEPGAPELYGALHDDSEVDHVAHGPSVHDHVVHDLDAAASEAEA